MGPKGMTKPFGRGLGPNDLSRRHDCFDVIVSGRSTYWPKQTCAGAKVLKGPQPKALVHCQNETAIQGNLPPNPSRSLLEGFDRY